jgi:predicted HAD superfamily Cof-like phosphohydrolase
MQIPPASTPVACDMSHGRDTPAERLAEYHRLFGRTLAGRERTAAGIRFRFRAGPGVEEWVRDLAAREKACCPFFGFDITADGAEVCWDAAVSDSDAARAVLEEFYALGSSKG